LERNSVSSSRLMTFAGMFTLFAGATVLSLRRAA
jgi:hypothetical protein